MGKNPFLELDEGDAEAPNDASEDAEDIEDPEHPSPGKLIKEALETEIPGSPSGDSEPPEATGK